MTEVTEELDMTPCGSCETDTENVDLHTVADGTEVCEDCLNNNYTMCERCSESHDQSDVTELASGEFYCESCRDRWCTQCDHCADWTEGYTSDVEGVGAVCENCIESGSFSFCEECDTYYGDGYADEHNHNGCECEAPHQRFAMPMSGDMLQNDTRVEVSLPDGTITENGLELIAGVIRRHADSLPSLTTEDRDERYKWYDVSYLVEETTKLDPQVTTAQGSYAKRLTRLAYKHNGVKITPEITSAIGNLARDHSIGGTHSIEITRDLNLPAADFGHADSCWWQSYSESRCTLKGNGGFGLRAFRKDHYGNNVAGRAWVMPLVSKQEVVPLDKVVSADYMSYLTVEGPLQVKPTFVAGDDPTTAEAFVIFNGYGTLSGYAAVRIVSEMTGLPYSKIGFSGGEMYVNGESAYLVATPEMAKAIGNDLRLRVRGCNS